MPTAGSTRGSSPVTTAAKTLSRAAHFQGNAVPVTTRFSGTSGDPDVTATAAVAMRTAMEAVYTLLGASRSVPEVYDIRTPLAATGRLRDGKENDSSWPAFLRNLLMKWLDKTQIGVLLHEFKSVSDD